MSYQYTEGHDYKSGPMRDEVMAVALGLTGASVQKVLALLDEMLYEAWDAGRDAYADDHAYDDCEYTSCCGGCDDCC